MSMNTAGITSPYPVLLRRSADPTANTAFADMVLPQTLYILYNADGTVVGKLKYGYRKLSKSDPEPACAACDITHGGLSLSESPKWVESKKEIESHHVNVVQWHRDEVSQKVREYMTLNSIRFPAVILKDEEGGLSTVMTNGDLNDCAGDPKALVDVLYKKNILSQEKPEPSSL